jgi:hypothetical protein
MLIEQGGDLVLLDLIRDSKTNQCVLTLCGLVIATLAQKKFLSPAMIDGLQGTGITIVS